MFSYKTRQESAKELAKEVDCMIVIGGKHSSNTQKLVKVCEDLVPTFAIETKDELDVNTLKNIKIWVLQQGHLHLIG